MGEVPDISGALGWARGHIAAPEARILLRYVCQCTPSHLAAWPEKPLAVAEWEVFRSLVSRRAKGEPIAYIVGEREFYGRNFMVDARVLIPRPETELLVELAIAHHTAPFGQLTRPRVLELGTGSGAIAITLALELSDADITAIDVSRDALLVAVSNAVRLGASVAWLVSDWFSALNRQKYALIISNPPYIAEKDPHLGEGDLRFEPEEALASGYAGLDALTNIISAAGHHLEHNGWLFVEHGYDQAAIVRSLFTDAGFASIASWRDLAGVERVSAGQWRG